MIKEKLNTEKDFNRLFALAAQNDKMLGLIDILNELIVDNIRNYLAWLFLARAYEDVGEIEKAKNSYQQAYKLNPTEELGNEIQILNQKYVNLNKLSLPKSENIKTEQDSSQTIKETPKFKITNFKASQETSKSRNGKDKNQYHEGDFNKVHKQVLALKKEKSFQEALDLLNSELARVKNLDLNSKYLLDKAQLLSAWEKYEEAASAYKALIETNKKRTYDKKGANLSHLLYELARIQAVRLSQVQEAINSAKEGLKYNSQNKALRNFADNLLRITVLEDNQDSKDERSREEEYKLSIRDSEITLITPMLSMDIEEHEYTDEEIIKNDFKPTLEIALKLLKQASATQGTEIDLSERYPIYLETAKAFNDLPTGSNVTDYLHEALAFYATLKGNSLFLKFKKLIESENYQVREVTRLSDSACSYYLESLNLQYKLNKNNQTPIANYLKLQIALTKLKSGLEVEQSLKGALSKVLTACIESKDETVKETFYRSIISLGTASRQAWYTLYDNSHFKSTFSIPRFDDEDAKYGFFEELMKIENSQPIKKGESVKINQIFKQRELKNEKLEGLFKSLRQIRLNPRKIEEIKQKWEEIKTYQNLLTDTDLEVVQAIDKLISIYEPYQFRGNEERTRILRDVRVLLEDQQKFILENTTYWGRIAFYALIQKWQKDLKEIEDDRFEFTIPQIKPVIDPNFIQQDNEGNYINLLLKNEGVATAVAIQLDYSLANLSKNKCIENSYRLEEEIAVNSAKSVKILIPDDIMLSEPAIELQLSLIAFDYKQALPVKDFSFTVEKTSTQPLHYEDIPWKEDGITAQDLFKGREQVIEELIAHYQSFNRRKNYILYGLTRTGKSSILKYFGESINQKYLKIDGKEYKFISFTWDLGEASNQTQAKDLWGYFLVRKILYELQDKAEQKLIPDEVVPNFINEEKVRFKDWEIILNHLIKHQYFPIFLIDEFSYYRTLVDKRIIDASFLAAIREYTFKDVASFVFAGTYDVKELIKDNKYGITGQFVNLKEKIVSQIDETSAIELIEVIKDKLVFTKEAIRHILFLSNRVPYFIQIICKYCGYYAVENQKRYLGFAEVEQVASILVGEVSKPANSYLERLSVGTFMNNQDSPTDPKENKVLLSTIAYFNKGKAIPRGVSHIEMLELWGKSKVPNFNPLLAEAIESLKTKEILIEKEDEGKTVYFIGVDLFRRFWGNLHSNMELEFDALKEK